jgi:hypothetical protein
MLTIAGRTARGMIALFGGDSQDSEEAMFVATVTDNKGQCLPLLPVVIKLST